MPKPEVVAESLLDKAQRIYDANEMMERLLPTIAGPGLTSDMAEIAYAFLSLASACSDVLEIRKEEERMNKEYPAGTCNAEDAWKDFLNERERVWRNFVSAVDEVNAQR